jgi:hypothetical protein
VHGAAAELCVVLSSGLALSVAEVWCCAAAAGVWSRPQQGAAGAASAHECWPDCKAVMVRVVWVFALWLCTKWRGFGQGEVGARGFAYMGNGTTLQLPFRLQVVASAKCTSGEDRQQPQMRRDSSRAVRPEPEFGPQPLWPARYEELGSDKS